MAGMNLKLDLLESWQSPANRAHDKVSYMAGMLRSSNQN